MLKAVLTVIALVMFSFNVMFVVDLTLNHQAHSKSPLPLPVALSPERLCNIYSCMYISDHVISILRDNSVREGLGGQVDLWSRSKKNGEHALTQSYSIQVLSSKERVEIRVKEKVSFYNPV